MQRAKIGTRASSWIRLPAAHVQVLGVGLLGGGLVGQV